MSSSITRRSLENPNMAQSVQHNGVLYLAGQIGSDFRSSTGKQTQQVLDKIDTLLADAGVNKSRLLTATIFLSDMSDFAEMNAVWAPWLDDYNKPTRALVQAQIVDVPEGTVKVEIVVTAASD
jgi:enamine deaminase RidA (YjgF/YER057c/UK114 family)